MQNEARKKTGGGAKILFVTANRIGDAVLSTGLLAHLIAECPRACITVACGPAAAPLFEAVPEVSRVIPIPKRRWAAHWLSLWAKTATRRWDLVIDLRASLLPWALVAHARKGTLGGAGAAGRHRLETLKKVLDLAEIAPPKLWIPAAAEERASRIIEAAHPILTLGPTANWPGKIWPATRFADLARRLAGSRGPLPGATVLLLGGAGERGLAAPISAALSDRPLIDLVDRTTLLEAAALIARSDLFVGNDSGLMHIAAATGTPTIGLFGPSRETVYGPRGPRARAVRGTESFEEIVGRPGFDWHAGENHMTSLTVDEVEHAAIGLLASLARPARASPHGQTAETGLGRCARQG